MECRAGAWLAASWQQAWVFCLGESTSLEDPNLLAFGSEGQFLEEACLVGTLQGGNHLQGNQVVVHHQGKVESQEVDPQAENQEGGHPQRMVGNWKETWLYPQG